MFKLFLTKNHIIMKKSIRKKITILSTVVAVISGLSIAAYLYYLDLSAYTTGFDQPFEKTIPFVTEKFKGDGYYFQPDGVHTVAYKVDTSLTGSIKMQGSLATTPTEDDWFDISGTTFTTDQSTTISSANFTGNFVWVRAKATSITAGSITQILLNS